MEKVTGSRFMFDDMAKDTAKICVVGVGGGGGNAINNMVTQGIQGVHFIAINTDAQALHSNLAPNKIQAGRGLTKGLGTGARPKVGEDALFEDHQEIEQVLQDFDMVFVTAGMGGGTGTGGAPVVAEIARQLGILTVAIVTKPFACEGKMRMDMAVGGINCIRQHVDTLIVIPNERLLDIADEGTSLVEAFQLVDDVLYNATRGISDLITINGLINLDFADVRTTMQEGGTALMGSATASGKNRAETAAVEAISSPLLDGLSIGGARNILVNITAGKSLGIREATTATNIIKQEAGDNVEVIFGTVVNEEMGDDLRITVIATGFGQPALPQRTVPIAKPDDYKGEKSLRILDKPAYERRGKPQGGVAKGGNGEPGKGIRKVESRNLEKTPKNSEEDSKESEKPMFLRKMMD